MSSDWEAFSNPPPNSPPFLGQFSANRRPMVDTSDIKKERTSSLKEVEDRRREGERCQKEWQQLQKIQSDAIKNLQELLNSLQQFMKRNQDVLPLMTRHKLQIKQRNLEAALGALWRGSANRDLDLSDFIDSKAKIVRLVKPEGSSAPTHNQLRVK